MKRLFLIGLILSFTCLAYSETTYMVGSATPIIINYSLPSNTCPEGQILKANANGNMVCGTDNSGGSPTWGSITGTLSSQTDLQGVLDGKASSLGADDNYVTDAEKVVIGNTSGTNTGNQTLPTDATITTTDVTTNDASVSKHGWFPKLPTPSAKYLKDDMTWATPGGGDDARIIMDALTTGEQFDVTASTTLVEITNLSQTLSAGTYAFQYFVIYRSNQATNGIRYAVNYTGTNGAFVYWFRWSDIIATASSAAPKQAVSALTAGQCLGSFANRAKSTTSIGTTISVDAADSDMMMISEGVFVATGAGDLELWTASEVNTAAYTTSTMIGTSVIIHKTK